jgi:hypothetical protein
MHSKGAFLPRATYELALSGPCAHENEPEASRKAGDQMLSGSKY